MTFGNWYQFMTDLFTGIALRVMVALEVMRGQEASQLTWLTSPNQWVGFSFLKNGYSSHPQRVAPDLS